MPIELKAPPVHRRNTLRKLFRSMLTTGANQSASLTVLTIRSPIKELTDARRRIEMTFDQALEALKDAWIERCLSGGSTRLNARLFAARRLIDSHPEFDRGRYDAAFDDANRIAALHRRILQAWSPG
jgi:hypothetical protein